MRCLISLLLLTLILAFTPGCSERGALAADAGHDRALAGLARALPSDAALDVCRARAADIRRTPDLGGAPAFEERRIAILGRARGEPMVLLREPRPTPDEALPPALLASRRAFERDPPGSRIVKARSRHRADPAALRALLLREGYLYATEPRDALAMVTALELPDLFAESEIWLARGKEQHRLVRVVEGRGRRQVTSYRHAGGSQDGRRADIIFGDRVAVTREALDAPLHRDLRALAEEIGFDRARVLYRTEGALIAELRFEADSRPVLVEAVLEADGAALRLGCLAADAATRAAVEAGQRATAWRRRALARMRQAVGDLVGDALRFDRPEGEEGPDRDGHLRPVWLDAYLRGRESFQVDEKSYPVFDAAGKAWPPQVCVDFVLESYERASGTWFSPRGAKPERVKGRLDFDETGVKNRRGVIAFGDFVESRPDLFSFRRFQGEERIPFGERERFFQFLVDHADEVRPGDVVAIHGLKRDERIHQHAILVEWVDPVTGFPAGLADQMKRPRRRTWEGIMAEAPKRSLYYRARPTEAVLGRLDPEAPPQGKLAAR